MNKSDLLYDYYHTSVLSFKNFFYFLFLYFFKLNVGVVQCKFKLTVFLLEMVSTKEINIDE
jgi:hypothetical protein